MKGILKKAAKGWFVWYDILKDEVTTGYESLPLLQLKFSVSEKQSIIPLENDKQVEFEIVKYCPYHQSNPSKCTRDCMHSEVKYAIIYDVHKEESEPLMTLNKAVSILKIHQEWRKGADIVMIEPRELSEAIDMILSYHQIIQKIKI